MPLSNLIPSLIILVSGLGILILFLRKLPEAVEGKNQGAINLDGAVKKNILKPAAISFFSTAAKKAWHFVLEAKDFKQGQILASKFSKLVPAKKVFNIGTISTLKKAQRLFEQNDLDESERVYLGVIKKYPGEYRAYEGLINIYLKHKNYQQVQEVLEYLIRHNPESDNYISQLGSVLMKRRKYKEAIEAYQKALTINNLVPARFINIGLCHESLNELEEAAANFQKALDLEPANVQYLMMLVDILGKLKQLDLAKKVLETASAANPGDKQIKEKLLSL